MLSTFISETIYFRVDPYYQVLPYLMIVVELCIHILSHVGVTHPLLCWMQTLILIKKLNTGNFEQLFFKSEYIHMAIRCN